MIAGADFNNWLNNIVNGGKIVEILILEQMEPRQLMTLPHIFFRGGCVHWLHQSKESHPVFPSAILARLVVRRRLEIAGFASFRHPLGQPFQK